MFRLEMSLSVDGKLVSYDPAVPPRDIEPMICHLSLRWEKQSDIVSMLTCVSQVLQNLSSHKDNSPGKPVEDQEQSISGKVIFYPRDCKDCKGMISQIPPQNLRTGPDGHLQYKSLEPST